MKGTKPSSAQLRLLRDLVAAGGEGYASELVGNASTVSACRAAAWVEYVPVPGKPFEIGKHRITAAGRKAAAAGSPTKEDQ